MKKLKDIKDLKDIRELAGSKSFKALMIFGLAKKLVLLAIWFLPDLF